MNVNNSKRLSKNQDNSDPNTTDHHLSETLEEKSTKTRTSMTDNPLDTVPAEDPKYTIDIIWGTRK